MANGATQLTTCPSFIFSQSFPDQRVKCVAQFWYGITLLPPFTPFSLLLEYDEGQKEKTLFIFFTSQRPQPIPTYLQDIDFSFDPFFLVKLWVFCVTFFLIG